MVELFFPTTLRATARIAVWSFQEWVNNKIPAGVNWWCLGIERSSRQSQGCQGEWDRGHSQIVDTPTGKDASILNLTMHGMIDLLNAGTCYWDHSALSSSQSLFLPSRFDGKSKKELLLTIDESIVTISHVMYARSQNVKFKYVLLCHAMNHPNSELFIELFPMRWCK